MSFLHDIIQQWFKCIIKMFLNNKCCARCESKVIRWGVAVFCIVKKIKSLFWTKVDFTWNPSVPAERPLGKRQLNGNESGSVRYRLDSYATRGMDLDRGLATGANSPPAAVNPPESNAGNRRLSAWLGESKSGRFCSCFWNAKISCSGVCWYDVESARA